MEYRRFKNTLVVRIDRGEEILSCVKAVAVREAVRLARVSALGAVGSFTVGAFDTAHKTYRSNRFEGDYEIVSLTGTIDTMDGAFYCHLHMSAGDAEGRVFGGHLNEAVVSGTCEMVIDCIPGTVDRAFDEDVGLNLFRF